METFNPVALSVVMARRHTTAPELAKALGKRTSKVTKYLFGISEPSEQEIARIAQHFSWPVGFFYRHDIPVIDPNSVSIR